MALRVCFIGFRHGHIGSLYRLLHARDDVAIVAACEEDASTRTALAGSDTAITHDNYEAMLDEVDCDVVACGDYFGIRGARLIRALEHGRHVLVDKPVCTRLDELDVIEKLARDKGLRVGCMLDLVDAAPYLTMRRLVREGTIGEVHTISFFGQHPLNYCSRPAWYFEEGKHGGTLNDIAIHGLDAIPWMTGRAIVEITAARAWNARLKQHPFFQDGAQLMLRLDNGGGVLGDVSYLSPDAAGYAMPNYWHFGLHGTDGYMETCSAATSVRVFLKDVKEPRDVPLDPARPGGYFEDFLKDLAGAPNPDGLDTQRVLHSARLALEVQAAADTGRFPRPV